MQVWKRVTDEESGYLFHLSQSVAFVEWKNPGILNAVNDGEFVIVSDYSGQHKQSTHEAYSFLVTTSNAIAEWLEPRHAFREKWLPDGRRLSFKELREPVRRRALIPFLQTASLLRGNLFTILVNRRVDSFMSGGPAAIMDVFSDCFSKSDRPGTVEKMFRTASFVALLQCCLKREDQRGLWISDHDEVLETFERREGFGRRWRCLTFALSRWERPADVMFGTTETPPVPEWAEDAAAIPDIAAGAYSKLSGTLPTFKGRETWTHVASTRDVKDQRALAVGNWMALSNGPLRSILLRLEHDEQGYVKA